MGTAAPPHLQGTRNDKSGGSNFSQLTDSAAGEHDHAGPGEVGGVQGAGGAYPVGPYVGPEVPEGVTGCQRYRRCRAWLKHLLRR